MSKESLYGKYFDQFATALNKVQKAGLPASEAAARIIEISTQVPAPQVLDSKYKVIGTVIAIAKNTNLAPGQQTSFSGLGSVSQGTNPVYFKLTYDWL